MAVARLSKATVKSSRGEIGVLLLRLMQFGQFHPFRKREYVQDIDILLLASHAQAVYSNASGLLGKETLKTMNSVPPFPAREFVGYDLNELIRTLEDEVATLGEILAYSPTGPEKAEVYNLLISIREASLAVFNNLQKILVEQEQDDGILIEGFVPNNSVSFFRNLVGKYLVSIRELDRKESQAPTTPSLVVNYGAISMFQDITLQRGVPKYNEIDPTPMVAFVFPLFFGIMFGDVGHGATLLLFGWYLYSKTKYLYWGKMLAVLGSSTLVVGFVRGLFFGLEFPSPIQHLFPITQALSAGFTFQNIPLILEIAIVIGTFHLGTAYAISFVNELKSSNYLEAFLNKLATLLLYGSIIPFGLAVAGTGLQFGVLFTSTVSTPFFNELLGVNIAVSLLARDSLPFILGSLFVLSISHLIITYDSLHKRKDMIRSLGSGLLEVVAKPFEFFTNVLSYVRLGVLLITTYVLGSLVAGVLSFGVLGALFAIFLNLMVIAMEGLIVYIQDMRLHLYEWLSKFYIGTGTPFAPLVAKGKHFAIGSQERSFEARAT